MTERVLDPAPLSTRMTPVLRARWFPAVLAVGALALRLPAFLAGRHLSFDDGVYGASAVAMRHGAMPFRDVFSSQGPLYLALVRAADVVGFEARVAPRLLAVASGVAVTLGAWWVARRLAGPAAGALAGALVATSGSVMWVTGALASDGPTVALSVWAVAAALAFRDRPSLALAVAMGVLAGAAFAVKSLFAVPAGLAIAWVLLEGRHWRAVAAGVASAALVVVAVSVPFGPADVWDQSVTYHLEVAAERTPGANANKVVTTLWDRDLLVLVAVVAAGALALWSSRRPPAAFAGPGTGARRAAPVLAWLGGVVLVLLLEHPMWRPHLSHLVVPLAVAAVWWARHRLAVFGAVLAVAAVGHAVTVAGIVAPGDYPAPERRAVEALRALPDGALAISDEPGLVWAAGLRTPPDLVDTSMLRIETGRITPDSLAAAASEPGVCAVLVWSHRFGDLDLDLQGYTVTENFPGPRALHVRTPCRSGFS